MITKEIKFIPSFDKANPDPKKNYGVGSVMICFYLKGELGCVQFKMSTGWFLEHLEKRGDYFSIDKYPFKYVQAPRAIDLVYHSPKPMYGSHEPIDQSCEFLGGIPCYYDGSTLNAETILTVLIEEGSEGVWRELEVYYKKTFGELK